uniref:Uncharacterized protein n=1 Tax=Neisseria meningitidis alpha522 TaxID=996307 RepID=I4E4Q3_NEIME|nr:hypothetical protein NMALPHA522_0778 [Neisseria meningitidis alpha522]
MRRLDVWGGYISHPHQNAWILPYRPNKIRIRLKKRLKKPTPPYRQNRRRKLINKRYRQSGTQSITFYFKRNNGRLRPQIENPSPPVPCRRLPPRPPFS